MKETAMTLRDINGPIRRRIISRRTELQRQDSSLTMLAAQNKAIAWLRADGWVVPPVEGEEE
jgi:hypothetical protein